MEPGGEGRHKYTDARQKEIRRVFILEERQIEATEERTIRGTNMSKMSVTY